MNKVVLAYSGSIDSTLCIHWLKEHHDLEVIALVVDLGLDEDYVRMADRALRSGASTAHFEDLTEDFCENFIKPVLFANLRTYNGDTLGTALGRPAICKAMVAMAHEIEATHVAIGCKPESDDAIRFVNSLTALDPDIQILQPLGEWHLKTRDQKLEYARKHNVELDVDLTPDERSIDGNIWGHVTFRHSIDDTWVSPNKSSYRITRPPTETPMDPEEITIEFKHGAPISLNAKKMSMSEIIGALNELGGRHCVGHLDTIGHKLHGLKTRKIIESPGAVILIEAHQAIESLTLDRPVIELKNQNLQAYCQIVSHGFWFTQYRESLDAFMRQTQTWVNGEVRIQIFHGHVTIMGRRSKKALSVESEGMVGMRSAKLLRSSTPFKKNK